MEARLIAHTMLTGLTESVMPQQDGTDADTLGEYAGRLCYKSHGRPRPATARTYDYLGNILAQQHTSVLGHASASFEIIGVSRTLTHELIRHRWFTFSELSQRYVEATDFEPVIPPDMDSREAEDLRTTFTFGVEQYVRALNMLENRGIEGKQARQAARAHLANCTATEIVATSNLRGWRDFITQRNSPAADTEIRQLAEVILTELDTIAPGTFQDLV